MALVESADNLLDRRWRDEEPMVVVNDEAALGDSEVVPDSLV